MRLPPRFNRTAPLFPYTTLFRSARDPRAHRILAGPRAPPPRTHPVRPRRRGLDERISLSMSWRRLPITQVDAFADRPFTGNPAAVMPLEEWLDDATLQAIAAENNLAETAFLIPDRSEEHTSEPQSLM